LRGCLGFARWSRQAVAIADVERIEGSAGDSVGLLMNSGHVVSTYRSGISWAAFSAVSAGLGAALSIASGPFDMLGADGIVDGGARCPPAFRF
jgi:hypothetical protein